jgi:hypothetical protein
LRETAIRRLSIDIDTVCGAPHRELEAVLENIKGKSPFLRYEENVRGDRGLPRRRHFKFYYQSMDPNFLGAHVLLDVVEEFRCPHLTQKIPIKVPFVEVEREVLVTLPTVESLLGDKLTAFAPTTVGVPLVLDDGRASEFKQRCDGLGIKGVTLHSYRYDWAECLLMSQGNGRNQKCKLHL